MSLLREMLSEPMDVSVFDLPQCLTVTVVSCLSAALVALTVWSAVWEVLSKVF